MRDAVYHQYAQSFDTHWWAEHRRALVTRFLHQWGVDPDGSHEVLEVGCGAGTEHAFLHGYGNVTGIEINETGLGYCKRRGYATLIAGDLNEVALPAQHFDIAVDFHVLYHAWVLDPAQVLARMHDALRPGGCLVMSEPAYMLLRRGHDDAVMAARRWTRSDLLDLVRNAGFNVEVCTGFLTLLAPAVLLSLVGDRLRERNLAKDTHGDVDELQPPHPLVDRVLRSVMAVERQMIRMHPLPVGTCWALVARRA